MSSLTDKESIIKKLKERLDQLEKGEGFGGDDRYHSGRIDELSIILDMLEEE